MSTIIASLPSFTLAVVRAMLVSGERTKKSALAAVRASGMKGVAASTAAADAAEAVNILDQTRAAARQGRIIRRLPQTAATIASATRSCMSSAGRVSVDGDAILRAARAPQAARKAPVVFAGTIRARLAEVRRKAVMSAAYASLRFPSAGHGEEKVRLTADPKKVGITQAASTTRDLYRGSFKGWSARVTDTTITVPAQWRTRVAARDLADAGGLFTLDAQPVDCALEGAELFSAVWAEQGRGHEIRDIRGYIARRNGTEFHAETREAAIRGLLRKEGASVRAAALEAALRLPLETLLGRLSAGDLDAIRVTVADARREDCCEFGIQSWCARTGLDYEAGTASLAEVVAAYRAVPVTEARRVILAVLARSRRACLIAA